MERRLGVDDTNPRKSHERYLGGKDGDRHRFHLTPFVGSLIKWVRGALVDHLALEGRQVESFETGSRNDGDAWSVVLSVEVAAGRSVTLEVFALSTRRAWFDDGHFAYSYRSPDGVDPFADDELRAWLEGFRSDLKERAHRGAADVTAAALTKAMEAYLPYYDVADHMYRQIGPHRLGLGGTLRLGFRCNQRCSICWQGRDWPAPPESLFATWLDELAAEGIDCIGLTGGEPTLYETLPDLVRRACGHGMSVSLETNAIRLAQPKYLAELREAGLRAVFVSYHSPRPEVSDAITSAPGTHVKTVEGIKACLHAGIQVRLNCVVERDNFDHLEEHARYVVERFVRPFEGGESIDNPVKGVTYSFPMDYLDSEMYRRHVAPLDEVEPHLVAALRVLIEAEVEANPLGTCGFPPCVVRDVPEVLWFVDPESASGADRWGRKYVDACHRCAVRDGCLGLRLEYLRCYGDRGLIPFEEAPPGYGGRV